MGEAGAYPGATRALYSWLPTKERGLGQAIFHSGARIGAAASLVIMPWLSESKVAYIQIVTSANVLLAMFLFAASNITFFISITWLQPYLLQTWGDEYAYLASFPLLCGTVAL